MAVQPVPEGYHSVTPYLIVRGAAAAIEFYKQAFNAVELMRLPHGDKLGHAGLMFGDSHVMLADEYPEMGTVGPQTLGGTPTGLCLYVPDCDAVVQRAVDAGAKLERPLQDQFYGDRSGTVIDPFGHKWTIATHIEDLSPDEICKRMDAWAESQK